MSTFRGFLSDPSLNFIAIDYFESSTYRCNVFMLSHVHWDHLTGFFDPKFVSLINESPDKRLYCSTLTAHLLTKFRDFGLAAEKIVAVDVNDSFIVRHAGVATDVAVTCLAAGHCPGSVMFLLEYAGKRVLYTGDFRTRVADLKKVRGRLTNADGTVIPVDELYLDTTFAFRSPLDDFPARESSEQLIVDRIERWLRDVGPGLRVTLSLPARYGIEYLYMGLSRRFGKPVSVHDYDSYAQVEPVAAHVVSFEAGVDHRWFIHACLRPKRCSLASYDRLRTIRPCALNFLRKKDRDALQVDEKYNVPYDEQGGDVLRVFYSSHCSLNELRDVVKFFRPTRIFPNVRSDAMTDEELIDLLRSDEPLQRARDSTHASSNFENVLSSRENVIRRSLVRKGSLEEVKERRQYFRNKYNLKF